ncbi:hypothetical protein COM83_32125 [Bacillus cereus]|nr:hypothetical protein COM83_32125 [Bacillus cereus]PFJ45221.1 hypothetical protein COI99_28495 [Bacillus cereus]PFW08782.1 hypothetical protein COL18_26585 [Bacillus cereus]PGW92597.1 hypothetical protein COE40_30020 [Bacillus cereus]PGY15578.1 hypothetical protein COE16_26360 [Bacillus cereus]
MKTYKCFVRWSNADKEYLSEFIVKTENSMSWLHEDIANSYNKQFRYLLDGRLLGIEIEEIAEEVKVSGT